MNKVLLIVSLLVACAVALNLQATTPIAARTTSPVSRWHIIGEAQAHETISFKILLKQNNLDKLDAIFWEVSNPKHENYGKFLSQQELRDLTASDKKAVRSVLEWLIVAGVPKSDIIAYSDYIHVITSVDKASALFSTSFAIYKSSKTDHTRVRIVGEASIPIELAQYIDFVSGISELIDDTRIHPKEHTVVTADPNIITPMVLKNYYGVTGIASNANNTQGIAAFDDNFSAGALAAFDNHFEITGVAVYTSGPNCLNESTCDQYESDLDVQYITAMALGVKTQFMAHGGSEWILDFALQLKSMSGAPLVNSISYGWAELEQCEITSCQSYGYDSQQYVTRTDTELQGLGALGLTVLVSDGDDGAPSLGGATGNCPIDPSKYCPLGGCAHSDTKCAGITFTITSNDTECFFPMGVGSDACATVLSLSSVNSVLEAFAEANPSCEFNLEQDAKQNYHIYSKCECSKLKDATVDGLKLSGYVYNQNAGAVFAADYPTSSPYVTSVGATQFTWSNGKITSEIGASILTGAIITTGGGFSSFQDQPSYQAAAVQSYISSGVTLPPTFTFNPKMRAYPDVALNGHNYLIYASNNTADLNVCPCVSLPVDGTSCSSPAFAGLLSLINDQLLSAGKSPLGFLNPLLYQMAASTPAAFTDITSGSNECNRAYCCQYGFQAASGWDPVSGLGSPVYPKFSAYVLQAKGVTN